MVNAPGGVAQGLEQAAHNRLVVGSNPTAPTRFYTSRHFRQFFSSKFLLSTLQILVCVFYAIFARKMCSKAHLYPYKIVC